MKKNNTAQRSSKAKWKATAGALTIGMDLGDKTSRYCVLNEAGEVVEEGSVAITKKGMAQVFGALRRSRMGMEVGTHSPWVSRLLQSFGREMIVANARQVKLISQSSRKDDRLDAQTLARLARVDPQLLRPIRHRSEEAQKDLMEMRVRASLVEARTALVNSARGLAKALGERLPKCDTGPPWGGTNGSAAARRATDAAAVAGTDRNVDGTDLGLRPTARADRPDQVSGNRTPAPSERSGTFDRSHVCADHRRPGTFSEKPRRGLLCRLASQAQRVRGTAGATGHQQRGRCIFTQAAGAGSALRFGAACAGYGSEALGSEAGHTRRQECEEAGDRRRGAQAGFCCVGCG